MISGLGRRRREVITMKCSNGGDGSEWSLHAQLILKHGGQANACEDGAVRMEYSWSPAPRSSDPKPLYAFRRGDLIFTAAPPNCGINHLQQQQHPAAAAHTLPRTVRPAAQLSCSTVVCVAEVPPTTTTGDHRRTTPQQPYERRCQSSCSITLSSCGDEKPPGPGHSRAQSAEKDKEVPFIKKPSRAHTFTTQFRTQVVNEKQIRDAASQTNRCPSPVVAAGAPKPADSLTTRISTYKRGPSRSPANGRVSGRSKSFTQGKQPRTVHIDVYCTGSDDADDSGSSGSEIIDRSKTVFDGQDVRVQHRRATAREIPLRRRRTVRRVVPCQPVVVGPTVLPDAADSSLSVNSILTNSISSVSTNPPISSREEEEEEDTVSSSWKETDIECLRLSALSIGSSSVPNDSFDYADSSDRRRILKMAERWQCSDSVESRRRQVDDSRSRNFVMYPKRSMQNSTDSLDDDDASEMGWTFSLDGADENCYKVAADPSGQSDSTPSTVYRYARRSVLGPFGIRPPSPRPAKLEDAKIKPFTNHVEKTECFARAEKFGVIVGSLKKPGHHVGPAKNPDCTCFTCMKYFEEHRGRGRTRSVGDLPKSVNLPLRSRLSSCERESVCSQFSYIKDLV